MRQESTDDYLTKPFVTGVLLARLEALLRRWRRRPELLQEVWGYDPAVTSPSVDIHVAELRRKLEADAAEPKHIITVSKRGYRLQA
jgi:two-component system, OmpR family, response regulator RegX3